MRNILKNGTLFLAAIIVSLLVSEVVVRYFFHPVDHLLPRLEADSVLGHRIASNTGGHDSLGFRNYTLPSKAEIVAIGDSHTYGVSATFQNSWPAQLSNMRSSIVYNMALGGYGPPHYLHLLKTKTLDFAPKIVIVGLYFGNDLVDAYNLVYSNEYWQKYRNPEIIGANAKNTTATTTQIKGKFLNETRNWLAHRSVLYRLITQSAMGNVVRIIEFKSEASEVIDIKLATVRQFFMPGYRLESLDRNSLKVEEGIRISKVVIHEIKQYCLSNQIELIFVLIPTKELVYSKLLKDSLNNKIPNVLLKSFEYEVSIRSEFFQYFKKSNIRYIDVLPALREAATNGKDIYPINDGHTNGQGYSVIAKKINDSL